MKGKRFILEYFLIHFETKNFVWQRDSHSDSQSFFVLPSSLSLAFVSFGRYRLSGCRFTFKHGRRWVGQSKEWFQPSQKRETFYYLRHIPFLLVGTQILSIDKKPNEWFPAIDKKLINSIRFRNRVWWSLNRGWFNLIGPFFIAQWVGVRIKSARCII